MNRIRTRSFALLALILYLTGTAAGTTSGNQKGATKSAMDTLVTAEWLRDHLEDPDIVVIDATVLIERDEYGRMRAVSGIENYDAGHIPSAVFADLLGDLSDAGSSLEFAVPLPEHFAAAMAALGVGDDSRVILYDAGGSVWAARVWWMLRWIGFDRAALLDGGQQAWVALGEDLSTARANVPAGSLTIMLRPELVADQAEVRASLDGHTARLIDALPPGHFRGEWAMYERGGHIAGAENVPVASLFDDAGRFRPDEELSKLFQGDRDKRTITYCGGGIAASADAFVLTRLGFNDVAIYAASLQEWAVDPDNPMESDFDFDDEE